MVTLESIKKSLRIVIDSDDSMIQNYIDTAEEYIQTAVDSTKERPFFDEYKQFDIAVTFLVEFWYQTRGAMGDSDKTIPTLVTSMIQQLRGKID